MRWYTDVFFIESSIPFTSRVEAYSVHPSWEFRQRGFFRGATIDVATRSDAYSCELSLGSGGRRRVSLTTVVVPAE